MMLKNIYKKKYRNNYQSVLDGYKRISKLGKHKNTRAIELIGFNEIRKEIDFNFYHNHTTLRKWINKLILSGKFLSNQTTVKEIIENIGTFIATYHHSTASSNLAPWLLHDKKAQTNTNGFLHGDLTDNNILINPDNEVVIIDWESTPILNHYFNYGNVLWDIVWFSSALLRPSPGTFFYTSQRIKMVHFFISGYEKIYPIDMNEFIFYYNSNIKVLLKKIYKKHNFYNTVLLKKHFKNWESLKKKLLA